MKETGFRSYLKRKRRSPHAIEQCVRFTRQFEQFLQQSDPSLNLENADEPCLQDFLTGTRYRNAALWGIGRYYEFMGNHSMHQIASRLREQGIAQARSRKNHPSLTDQLGINAEYLNRLTGQGIADIFILLEAGSTAAKRDESARTCRIPVDDLLKMVLLADLTRIVDIKSLRVRLLYAAGYDTLEKIAASEPNLLRQRLISPNEKTHILRRAPTLVETAYWIRQAQALPKILQD